MDNILTSVPDEIIRVVLSEFNKPTNSPSFDAISIEDNRKNEIIEELSKVYAILSNHSTEVTIDLLKETNVPQNIIKLAIKLRQEHVTNVTKPKSNYTFSWRLDQSVPNVQAILLNISNEETKHVTTMRMDVSTFHKLRFNVASLLKEFDALCTRICKE